MKKILGLAGRFYSTPSSSPPSTHVCTMALLWQGLLSPMKLEMCCSKGKRTPEVFLEKINDALVKEIHQSSESFLTNRPHVAQPSIRSVFHPAVHASTTDPRTRRILDGHHAIEDDRRDKTIHVDLDSTMATALHPCCSIRK